MRSLAILIIMLFISSPLRCEELSILGGIMRNSATNDGSYSWQVEYLQRLDKHFAASVSYLNEGHVPDHHRDGHALTLWTRTDALNRQLTLAAGAGPYFYYDTTTARNGANYSNSHGWGTIFSLTATWHLNSNLQLILRSNAVKTFNSIDTFSTLVGIGYNLEPRYTEDGAETERADGKAQKLNEVTFFGGQTIVNSFNSDKSIATSIEYRRRLMRYLDGTAAWIYEGDNRLLRRHGASAQLWAVNSFLDDTVSVGMGAGAYLSVDHYHSANQRNRTVSGIVSLTASYSFHPDWNLRTSWHRIVTDYNRDTDILLGGIGYRF